MDAVSPQPSGGSGNITLYIVIFFLCIISVLFGVFSFRARAAQTEFDQERAKAQADEKARITEIEQERVKAEAEFEQERVKAEAEFDKERAEIEEERTKARSNEKIRTSEISAKLSAREELLKKLEERVTADLSAAAKTVKDANQLKREATKASNDANWHLREAVKAQERADASGKENDKRLAEEKKKMADEATKKVEKAQKEADDAIEKATEEAKKAKELKEKLDEANARIDKLATPDDSVTFVTPDENEGVSPLQKEANDAVARFEELMAGGPPDARHPPTEEDIRDARNEAENAVAAAVATGGYNPYTIQEIKMVTKNEGVSQGIQQVGGGGEIQQVGGGGEIQQVEKKKGSPFQNNANKAVARLDGLMAGGGNSNSKAERRKEITDARNEAKQAIAHAVETGGYNPYDGSTNLPTKVQLMREPKPNKSKMNIQQVGGGEIQQIGMVQGYL